MTFVCALLLLQETDEVSVNVYVFLVARDHAILLDSHYNARALPGAGMLLVVANAARRCGLGKGRLAAAILVQGALLLRMPLVNGCGAHQSLSSS